MAYQTGTAASMSALLSALQTFATANGWTASASDTVTLNFGTTNPAHNTQTSIFIQGNTQGQNSVTANRLVLTKGGVSFQVFAYLKTCVKKNVVGSYGVLEGWVCDSFNGGTSAWLQTNNRKITTCGPLYTTIPAYHFFAGSDYLHVVLEETTGQFRHFSVGFLNKYSTFTGGQYISSAGWNEPTTGTSSFNNTNNVMPFGEAQSGSSTPDTSDTAATKFRADVDGQTNRWITPTTSSALISTSPKNAGFATYTNFFNSRAQEVAGPNSGADLIGGIAYLASPVSSSGITPMYPCLATAFRFPLIASSGWYLLGEFPDVRYLNMGNYAPGDEVTIGSDVWKIFPIFAKVYVDATYPCSWDHGIAYKKVT